MLSLHPLQHMVHPLKLQKEYEVSAMTVANSIGADLREIVDHPHLRTHLQFICGLGPRKARDLVDKVLTASKFPDMRLHLLYYAFMDKAVYMNCCAFIRISSGIDLRD